VIEAMNARSELYSFKRLDAVLRAVCKASPEDMVRGVTDDVHDFTGSAPKADDLTVLALRWFTTAP
jgi:phosphoserine phosphatase RsbU/P